MHSKPSMRLGMAAKQGLAQGWIAALLLGTLASSFRLVAQERAQGGLHLGGPTVAITYNLERAKIAGTGSGGFWLQGGGGDIALPIYKGLSLAGSVNGEHASNIRPGVNLSKVTYLAGPRYTFAARSHMQLFGEGLFGAAHGFDSLFPTSTGVTSTASSYAIQLGGGLDIAMRGGLGLRALEADYVRTGLPNNGNNSQNDLRLAFGLSYQLGRK
jgi:outer membrane immunogenic protein